MHPLRAYRKARKLTIDDVVAATKLSKATISRIRARAVVWLVP
jgi:transcriptional regulator with XRE-family HTH domain